MLRLVYANQTDALVARFGQNLDDEAQKSGFHPLHPVTLVVPSTAFAYYLKLEVAQNRGIAAHMRVAYLGDFIRQRLEEQHPTLRVATLDVLQGLILDRFSDAHLLSQPEFDPVRRYLEADHAGSPHQDLRRFQLSLEVARVFEERQKSAPILRPQGGPVFAYPWQTTLYRSLNLDSPLPEKPDAPTAHHLVAALPSLAWTSPAARLHFFVLDVLPPRTHLAIAHLAKLADLHVYALNPCAEFWEDARDEPTEDRTLLSRLGHARRRHTKLLNQLSDYNFDSAFVAPKRGGTLRRLQQEIFAGEPKPMAPPADGTKDQSLRISSCPSLRREVEIIAEKIAELGGKSEGPPLTLNEIAVIIPEHSAPMYRALLQTVFDEFNELPCHFLDVPLETSRVLEAVRCLLDLPFSRFERQDILRLVTHPCVLAQFPDAKSEEWIDWCDKLGIVYGLDHAAHADTYIEKDLFNWDQGLKRLLLGAFMSGTRSDDTRRVEIGAQAYLPYELSQDKLSALSQFVTLLRSLFEDMRFAEQQRMSLPEWAVFTEQMIHSYVKTTHDSEERDLLRAFDCIHKLGRLDVCEAKVSFAIAREFLKRSLGRLTSNRGQPMAQGVVVGKLSSLHAIPFKHVFMVGMGEGLFPRAGHTHAFGPLPAGTHELTPRERDEGRFLDVLSGTRCALHLSYVAQDNHTGEPLEPSKTIVELLEVLEARGLDPSRIEDMVEKHPLRRYAVDPKRISPTTPKATLRQRHCLHLRKTILEHLGGSAKDLSLSHLSMNLSPASWQHLTKTLRLLAPLPAHAKNTTPGLEGGSRALPFFALRHFLEDPFSAWVKHVLGVYDNTQGLMAPTHERFFTRFQDAHALLQGVFATTLKEESTTPLDDLATTLYQQEAETWELLGTRPTGIFKTIEENKYKAILEAWVRHAELVTDGRPTRLKKLGFGLQSPGLDEARITPALDLELVDRAQKPYRVEISGDAGYLLARPLSLLHLHPRPMPKGRQILRFELAGFLELTMMAALGEYNEGPAEIYAGFGQKELHQVRFLTFPQEEAKRYIQTLVDELLNQSHNYWLPFDTLIRLQLAYRKKNASRSSLERILKRATQNTKAPALLGAPEPPELEEALHILENRLGPFFKKRQGELE